MKKSIFLLGFIIITMILGCSGARYPEPLDRDKLHITIYIDKSFSAMEENIIINSIKDWQCSTQQLFIAKISLKFEEDEYRYITDYDHSLIISKGTSDTPIIKKIDDEISVESGARHVVGVYVYNENYVPRIILVENRLNIFNYYAVSAHEVGHSLGLLHNSSTNSIMYPYMDQASNKITQEDLKDFCEAYRCDANELRVCK